MQRINVGENSYELMDTLMAFSHSLEQWHVFLRFHTHTDVPVSALLYNLFVVTLIIITPLMQEKKKKQKQKIEDKYVYLLCNFWKPYTKWPLQN